MYSTEYLIKLYILMNLIFLVLLISNDVGLYFILVEFLTLYFGCSTIYCLIEGNCYNSVANIFIFYFLSHLLAFFYYRGYFPNTIKHIENSVDNFREKIEKDVNKIIKTFKFIDPRL